MLKRKIVTLGADLTVQGRVAACERPIERRDVDGRCSSVTIDPRAMLVIRVRC
jgi:hypothetical protein